MSLVSSPLRGVAAAALLALAGAFAVPTVALAQSATPKIVKKVPPDFPEGALRRGVDRGVLKAKLTVDGAGTVTGVDIVDVSPAKARILNEAVIEALNKWRFEGSGKQAQFELQIVLTAE
ncbi:MAG: TonB family protein [Rubrivivax sp.]|jgi:protein TonB|nr:energy transducer TonB [Rubrivivax sp.]